MDKKVIDSFVGELYMCNPDEVQKSIKEKSKPDLDPFELKKINLIEDEKNQSTYLIGDSEGDDEYYSFTLKIFLYKDYKALGNCYYLAEAKMPQEKIYAKYLKWSSGFMIYGYFQYQGSDSKESFILFVEKSYDRDVDKRKAKIVPKPYEFKKVNLVPKVKNTKDVSSTRKTGKIVKPKKAAKSKIIETVSITDNFINLTSKADKQSCIYFLACILIKMGYTVQINPSIKELPELIIQKNNKSSHIYVNVSAKRKPSWNIINIKRNEFYIFCHNQSKDDFPDVYILKGSGVTNLIRRAGEINIEEKTMAKIKNSWAPLLD